MKPAPTEDWHPDVDTALVWRPHAQRQRRDDLLHYTKVLGLTLLLCGSGFAAVFAVRYFVS